MKSKRLLSVLVTMIMVFSMMPVFTAAAFAESGDKVMTYEELTNAINNKQETITLGADIDVSATLAVDYDCTINGGGFALNRAENFQGAILAAVKGSSNAEAVLSVKNMTIDGKNYAAYSSAVYAEKNTTISMENVTVQNNTTSLRSWKLNEKPYYCDGNGGAIYMETQAAVSLKSCKILGNTADDCGGGICGEADSEDAKDAISLTLSGCTVQNNAAGEYGYGGGIYMYNAAKVSISDSLINKNTAKYGGGLSFHYCTEEADDSNISLTNTTVSSNKATEGGGGLDITHSCVHLYKATSFKSNTAKNGGAANSQNGGNDDDTIIYMHDTSSMSYNRATQDGGAVYQWEQLLVMNDDSCLHHNTAAKNGGAVYTGSYGIIQNGGTIRDNKAGSKGGGVYNYAYDSAFKSGMIYDNTASDAGDDIFSEKTWETLYAVQPNRMYGDGSSEDLGTVSVEKIEGYHEEDLSKISVPYYGWFIDGTEDQVYKQVQTWKKNTSTGRYESVKVWKWVGNGTYSKESRYSTITDSVLVSEENENLDFLGGGENVDNTGGKAIWYGKLLAYDANYEGSSEYQYDANAYTPGTEAAVLANMFTRDGYRFTGWNTEADGSGTDYAPDDSIVMDKSQVLYAQWEKTDSQNPAGTDPANPTDKTDKTSQTGDKTNTELLFVLMILSFAALAGVYVYGRKHRYIGSNVKKG